MIAILTDFGHGDYLGVMKGVILERSPESIIVNLTNEVPRHNIRTGAWLLLKSFRFFPRGTVFLCVVDPGVGGKRQALAIRTENYYFVGPDNGLMEPAAQEDGLIDAVGLPDEGPGISRTFHGRDVFSKASALLDKGVSLARLGTPAKLKVMLNILPSKDRGEVIWIDSFGNIITNISHDGRSAYVLELKGIERRLGFFESYGVAPKKGLFLTNSSYGTLEISVLQGNAASMAGISIGEPVIIR